MRFEQLIGIYLIAMCLILTGHLMKHHGNREGPFFTKEVSYSYEDVGNLACEKGEKQSPIRIEDKNVHQQDMPNIQIHYSGEPVQLKKREHTLEALAAGRSYLLINQEKFHVDSFHFHLPSEHQLEGRQYEMELHIVHKNKKGELAVAAVFIQSGKENTHVKEMWEFLNDETAEERDNVSIDISELVPKEKTAFSYSGSLTTPPCTEGVEWVVFEAPIEFSKEQVLAFQEVYGNNNRPLQPLNGREVYKISVH